MTEAEKRVLHFINQLQHAYLEERDIEFVLTCLDPAVVWTGTGREENRLGFAQARNYLMLERLSHLEPIAVCSSAYEVQTLETDLYLVEGESTVKDRGSLFLLRLTALCREHKGRLFLWRFHLSSPAGVDEEVVPTAISIDQLGLLRRLVDEQSQELAEKNENLSALLSNLPGGVISCTATDDLTLLQFSQGFLDMVGYSAVEIHQQFHDRFVELIEPEDLERTWQEVWKQLALRDTKEIEYRVRRKDGTLIHILDRGQLVTKETGESVFYCILMDVTESKKSQEELRLSLERYRIITDQVNDIIFEWDVEEDELYYISANFRKKFGYDIVQKKASASIPSRGHLHADDINAYLDMIERIKNRSEYEEAEFRILHQDGRYLWCRVRVTLLQGETGARGVGVIMDIDREKREAQLLLQRAERDGLTGLYNKETTRALTEKYLPLAAPEELGALMIIDVDNFKQVNDRYGHLVGDLILSDIAGILGRMFRDKDVIGRVGGDEFAVYLRDLRNRGVAERKAKMVLAEFGSLVESRPDQEGISCSVGISFAPTDGSDYLTLFRNADRALYSAKAAGKNQVATYTSQMLLEEFAGAGEAYSSVGALIDSERGGQSSFGSKLAEYVFQVFYETENLNQAIPQILEIVGRQLDVSRVYIFEDSTDGSYCINTYEWCNEGIAPQIDLLQHVDYHALGDYYANFKDGIFYCRNVRQLSPPQRALMESQQVRSTLQCAIRDRGHNCGFVGFDECRDNRLWTQEQVDGVTLISQIVSTFLLKSRAQQDAREMLQVLQTVLDHQDSWIYVVSAEDYKLLYGNGALQKIWPKMAIGGYCYREFYDYESPCSICPLRKLNEKGEYSGALYSPVLKREVHSKVTSITWGNGVRAYLFSCTDYHLNTEV